MPRYSRLQALAAFVVALTCFAIGANAHGESHGQPALMNPVSNVVSSTSAASAGVVVNPATGFTSNTPVLAAQQDGHSSSHEGMTPFFHFHSGDKFYFEAFTLSSAGVIFAGCVVIFAIAILERFAAAARAFMERKFAQQHAARRANYGKGGEAPMELENFTPPFDIKHELSRGGLYGVQALLGYILMLGVMTFHAAILFAVVLGAAVGEICFGRVGKGHAAH